MVAVVGPTPRWTPLRYHADQSRLYRTKKRFVIGTAGRRGGKSENIKRFLIREALAFRKSNDGWFIAACPTRDQAKANYWDALKELTPPHLVAKINETDLMIRLITGTKVQVLGMDKPIRAEGPTLDGAVLDEYAAMKPEVWTRTIRPALGTLGRRGWCRFIGKPLGRNHYYELVLHAQKPENAADWEWIHWSSETVLDPEEIESLRRELDPLSYDQEVKGEFVTFAGLIYYCFRREVNAAEETKYDPKLPLVFCFDFNVEPGVASVLQEQRFRDEDRPRADRMDVADQVTAAVGEVWIPRASNTPTVVRKLIADWGPSGRNHLGDILVYGDPAGGARSTKFEEGSDWTIIRDMLRRAFPSYGSRDRVRLDVALHAPLERHRVNAVNTRLMNAAGQTRFLICPRKCPRLIQDFEGVVVKEGSDGEILKEPGGFLTHMSDGVGYYIHERFPAEGPSITLQRI